jgi:CPA2 family monovalent cation:H+ antiporter-2
MDILAIIVITLFIALITNIVLKKLHLPVIIGYIFTGIIIAYSLDFIKAITI